MGAARDLPGACQGACQGAARELPGSCRGLGRNPPGSCRGLARDLRRSCRRWVATASRNVNTCLANNKIDAISEDTEALLCNMYRRVCVCLWKLCGLVVTRRNLCYETQLVTSHNLLLRDTTCYKPQLVVTRHNSTEKLPK